ncbi:MAG: helix-turn-helix domain-containing protein [Acutalibacteraceae bacterium]|jgi:AraC-like DNA-binding protein
MELTDEIYDYVQFLKREQGLLVTLHPKEYEPVITPSKLHRLNMHEHPYCIYGAADPAFHQHCVDCQVRVWKKSQQGAYGGTCFAGVREYVYPIFNGDHTVCFICVSGYRDEQGESYQHRIARVYGLDPEKLRQGYDALRPFPPQKEIDVLLRPLQRMLELAYRVSPSLAEDELCEKVVHHLQVNHTHRITVDELCDTFFCSRSTLSHRFKAYTGKSVSEYVNALRMEDAKSLLVDTRLSVSVIASTVGYENSNYFTNVFTKTVGEAPTAYRRRKRGG